MVSDNQYKECCDYLDELFAGLLINSTRENYAYVFTVPSSLLVERLFSSFKPLFQYATYQNDSSAIHFDFKAVPASSALLSKKGLEVAYNKIPKWFARYLTAEFPETSIYEREHFIQCLIEAAVQVPNIKIEEIKGFVQQTVDRYQTSFQDATSYQEKNAILIKMNHLYNVSRNPNKLSKLLQEKEHKPTSTSESINTPESRPTSTAPFTIPRPKTAGEARDIDEEPIEPIPIIRIPKIDNTRTTLSLSSCFGILVGFALLGWLIYSDKSDSYLLFLNHKSFLFVAVGTIACTMISYHGLYIGRACKEILQIFIPTHVGPKLLLNDVGTLIKWSKNFKAHHQARKPFRELEDLLSHHEDPDAAFTQTAIGYLLEQYEGAKLKSLLDNLVNTMFDRSQVQVRIIRSMGNIAITFGTIGTLINVVIGLSHSYSQLSEFSNVIASALVPLIYGLILAYVIFKPAARKLEQKNEMRRFRNQLLTCGFVLLTENKSSIEIQDTLNSFLDPVRHFDIVSR